MTTDTTGLAIIDAALALAAERSYLTVGLADIAAKAGVALEALRARYDGRIAILEEFARLIDQRMLAGHDASSAAEAPRDRLFEVMMRRFDCLAPYRPGLRGLRRVALSDPIFAGVLQNDGHFVVDFVAPGREPLRFVKFGQRFVHPVFDG